MLIFLSISFIIGFYFIKKYKRSPENIVLFVFSFLMLAAALFFGDVLERDKKIPKRSFTVIDKVKYNQCDKDSSCQEIYNLYLKTDNGFSFKESFDYNSYQNAAIGSKITYRQTYNKYLQTGGKPISNEE